MWDIRQQVLDAATAADIQIKELDSDERDTIRRQVVAKYTDDGINEWPIWERITSVDDIAPTAHHDQRAWEWVAEFVGNKEAILFFNEGNYSMFALEKGSDLVGVISETFNVEFYATNRSLEYLLCFNHHDFLIAAGSAALWLRSKVGAA